MDSYPPDTRRGGPWTPFMEPLSPRREIVETTALRVGDSIQWASHAGNLRTRRITDIYPSQDYPGMTCIRFSNMTPGLADPFYGDEQWTRLKRG